MKKIIALLLLTLTLTISLASCSSMKSYEKNLGDDYKVDVYDEDEIEELVETFDIDADDYGISSIMEAEDKDNGYYAYIIQCKSSKKAEELVDDLDDIVKTMDKYYSFDVDAVADGKFVLVGNEDVIDDALNK